MKKNNVVLLIALYFPPAAGIGTFRITKFAKYLKKLGYEPVIVSPNRKYYTNLDDTLLDDLKGIKRYEIDLIEDNSKLEKRFYHSLIQEMDKIYSEIGFSKAIITGGPFYYLKIGPFLNKRYGTKYIADFRDPWSLQKTIDGNVFQKLKNIVYKRIARMIEKSIFKYSSYITVVNETMKEEYSTVFPKYNNKIFTLPNAIDLEDYTSIEPYNFSDRVILYTGKFSTSSGFRDPTNFFLALKKINGNMKQPIKFVHVGGVEQEVVDIVKTLKCDSFVDFYGSMPYKDTISYCKGADILLILSTKERCEQTGKIYDYLGCYGKILAVTNKNNEIYKVCRKYDISVANPESVHDIEDNIKKLLDTDNIKYNDDFDTREKETKNLIKLLDTMDGRIV